MTDIHPTLAEAVNAAASGARRPAAGYRGH
jgi:hypothetical protein